jgi:hypothetical protein
VWPAVCVLGLAFEGTDVGSALLIGGLPILLCAGAAFGLRSFIIRRRCKLEKRMA